MSRSHSFHIHQVYIQPKTLDLLAKVSFIFSHDFSLSNIGLLILLHYDHFRTNNERDSTQALELFWSAQSIDFH